MPGSTFCLFFGREFQKSHFFFSDVNPGRFAYFHWRLPLALTLIYRFILAVYCVFWLAYTSRTPLVSFGGVTITIFAFLTTWTYIVLTVYLLVHFMHVVIYAFKTEISIWRRLTKENHRRLFDELQVQPSLWANDEYEYVPGNDTPEQLNNDNTDHSTDVAVLTPSTNLLGFLPKLVWLLYNVASLACILVTIIFWTMLWPYMGHVNGIDLLINFQLHAVTTIIIVIEHLLSAIPIRLYHYVYGLAYGLIYIIFSGILYGINHDYVLYKHVLDWDHPGTTAAVCCITAFVALPIIHLLLFAFSALKLFIYNRCNPEEL